MTQLEAMGLTFAIESVVAAVLGLYLSRAWWLCAAAAVAGTTVTHPILWATFFDVHAAMGSLATPVLEGCVMLAETLAYRLIVTSRWGEAALLSVIANCASWWVGEAIYALT